MMLHTLVELIHTLSCIRTRRLLCFLYLLLILGNIFMSLLKLKKIHLLAISLLMLNLKELNWNKVFILLLILLLQSFVITMMHLAILCFVDMYLLCLVPCILLSLTFCRRLMMGWSRGRLQFKKGRMMRTSTCWTRSCHGLPQVTSHHQLGHHIRLGFSRHPCTVSAISHSYDVQMRWSWMCWNRDDETLILFLVPAPETSWIILWTIESFCITCFGPFQALYHVRP